MNSGWLVLNKENHITSFQATRQVGRIFGKKTGHGGTLDPFAHGVLPIGVGNSACRCLSYILESDKVYLFTVLWGMSLDSLDITGQCQGYSSRVPSKEEILEVLPQFIGDLEQVPPVFSAIKKDGIPYYKRARLGEVCSPPSRKVRVDSLTLIKHFPDEGKTKFKVSCAKGFYVRALARDLGKCLKTFGCVSELNRIKAGPFCIEDGVFMDDLTSQTPLLPLDYPFKDMSKIVVDQQEAKKLRNGQSISYNSAKDSFAIYLANSMIGFGVCRCGRVFPKKILA